MLTCCFKSTIRGEAISSRIPLAITLESIDKTLPTVVFLRHGDKIKSDHMEDEAIA
jgi:hypothetical protein